MDYIQKTYKFKLKLNKKQSLRIGQWINTCRAVYNLAIETRQYRYVSHGVLLSGYALQKQLPDLRKEFDWIKDVPAESLVDVLERFDDAYKRFFNGAGFPKYARKDKYNSITFKRIRTNKENEILLPKIGAVRYFDSRPIKGKLRRATIKKEHDGYYISILTRQERSLTPHPNHDSQVGLDVGIAFFLSLSTGEQIENPKHFLKQHQNLRIEQRSLSRKVKGSKNWYKQKRRVTAVYAKISRCRRDFLHKQSLALVNQYGLIAIEDLKISNLICGNNISKYISDASWSTFFNQLEYKTDWANGKLVCVDPRYTSQTCNDCGAVDKKSRISQSKFVCTECGTESNADVNAAKNILARAIADVR